MGKPIKWASPLNGQTHLMGKPIKWASPFPKGVFSHFFPGRTPNARLIGHCHMTKCKLRQVRILFLINFALVEKRLKLQESESSMFVVSRVSEMFSLCFWPPWASLSKTNTAATFNNYYSILCTQMFRKEHIWNFDQQNDNTFRIQWPTQVWTNLKFAKGNQRKSKNMCVYMRPIMW